MELISPLHYFALETFVFVWPHSKRGILISLFETKRALVPISHFPAADRIDCVTDVRACSTLSFLEYSMTSELRHQRIE